MSCLGSATSGHGLNSYHVFSSLLRLTTAISERATKEATVDNESETAQNVCGASSSLVNEDFQQEKVYELFLSATPPSKLSSPEGLRSPNRDEETALHPSQETSAEGGGKKVLVKVTDFFPNVFRSIRSLSRVSEKMFTDEWTSISSVNMSLGAGRSNALFFPSKNRLFLCKTISENEVTVLRHILPTYVGHLRRYPNSFLTRFFLMMKVEVKNEVGLIVCFQDVCANAPRVHEKWDLKGRAPKPGKFGNQGANRVSLSSDLFDKKGREGESDVRNARNSLRKKNRWDKNENMAEGKAGETSRNCGAGSDNTAEPVDRTAPYSSLGSPLLHSASSNLPKCHVKNAETTHGREVRVRKDKDLVRLFWLVPSVRERVLYQLYEDYAYLGSVGVMDYSLFVAVCHTTEEFSGRQISTIFFSRSFSGAVEERRRSFSLFPFGGSFVDSGLERKPKSNFHTKRKGERFASDLPIESCEVLSSSEKSLQPPSSFASRTSRPLFSSREAPFNQGISSFGSQEVYYIGIIDMLTEYTFSKVVANFCKSFLWKSASLSTIPPASYKNRILNFSRVVFPPIDVLDDDLNSE